MFFLSDQYKVLVVFYNYFKFVQNIFIYSICLFFSEYLLNLPEVVDFKNTSLLRKFITIQGKIFPKRINKVSFKYQRSLSLALWFIF